MKPLIELNSVALSHGPRRILDEVSVRIAKGEVVALLGPSGSGKSTLMRIILGLLTPDAGTVHIEGALASEARRIVLPPEARSLAVVFQDLALWPHLTVAGNLRFVLNSAGVAKAEQADRIAQMLKRVGLCEMQERYPSQLSGGEQQRVAIARALVANPSAVLLDEPFANLDLCLKQDMLALLQSLFEEGGVTALYVTHDPLDAVALDARTLILETGKLVFDGAASKLREQQGSRFVEAVAKACVDTSTINA